ncbi:MAG: monoamine oxidase [Myxococcota bacterium]|jgi:monoamine oxidase
MPESISRFEYLRKNRASRAWGALNHALNQQLKTTSNPCMPKQNSLNGKHIVIIGSGVGGLTTAYELLSRNSAVKVTVLEARDRTGGRCMSLRTGDALTEDTSSALEGTRGETQVVRFDRPVGDSEPYLNAGPGRIPSSHRRLLDYLRRFGVEVEIYVMASGSNMSQMSDGPEGDLPVVNRRLTQNTRGHIAQMVFDNAEDLLDHGDHTAEQKTERIEQLRSLMVTFGDLTPEGQFVVGTSEPGEDDNVHASDRAGFSMLPGVRPGKIADEIGLDRLLASEFWKKTRVYQPVDFLWQPTLFQPVGGMDQVQHAFAQQVATLGGVIHLNSPVTSIDYDPSCKQYLITAAGHSEPLRADYCFCNAAMPFLEKMLSGWLQDPTEATGFSADFKAALGAVFAAQANEVETKRFLACTTKVGWQADRELWQGRPYSTQDESGQQVLAPDHDELGVVPIYGGISWTDHPITQIWYPSDAYHDQKGVLTGCYNFSSDACRSGHMTVEDRLIEAKAGAARFGDVFANGLGRGVAIAWQNMPHIKGGWAQWSNVEDSVTHFNVVTQGAAVVLSEEDANDPGPPTFFIVGDQVSSLPGWQEGAIAAALNAISRLARPDITLPHLRALPDPRMMVEGL